jgi:hypothetical protein
MPHYMGSVGQAHPASCLRYAFAHSTPSIIHRLQARSITGLNIYFQVHQHYGYRLRVNWKTNSRQAKKDLYGIERKFPSYCSMEYFCQGLQTLDGVSTCLSILWSDTFILEKSSPCFCLLGLPNQIGEFTTPHANRRQFQELCKFDTCYCGVTPASYALPWHRNETLQHTPLHSPLFLHH